MIMLAQCHWFNHRTITFGMSLTCTIFCHLVCCHILFPPVAICRRFIAKKTYHHIRKKRFVFHLVVCWLISSECGLEHSTYGGDCERKSDYMYAENKGLLGAAHAANHKQYKTFFCLGLYWLVSFLSTKAQVFFTGVGTLEKLTCIQQFGHC